jgi:hypothetical protein
MIAYGTQQEPCFQIMCLHEYTTVPADIFQILDIYQ